MNGFRKGSYLANPAGSGMGGGNASFRSAGGRIYASQGGYVNSVGGK